jgi:hypothetical protein
LFGLVSWGALAFLSTCCATSGATALIAALITVTAVVRAVGTNLVGTSTTVASNLYLQKGSSADT